ncbi:hypothetical protein LTR86_000136 [Recurvomyces mirabilis]|nr:hypothetical protein LTR86_000136 [Recurvomyces mirabilis]
MALSCTADRSGESYDFHDPIITTIMWSLLNGPTTATVFSGELQRVLEEAGYDTDAKTAPTRPATVFIENALTGIGDVLPYLRVIKVLSKHMRADYHILLNCISELAEVRSTLETELYASPNRTRKTDVKVYARQDEWVKALQAAPTVDMVIFNQDIKWLNGYCDDDEQQLWVRMYEAIKEKNAVFVHLECLWQGPGTSGNDTRWLNRLESKKATVQDYLDSLAKPKVNVAEVKNGRRNTLPRLFVECYPAWILTAEERARTTGILCRVAEPLLHTDTEKLDQTLLSFLQEQHEGGKKIILLARGGRSSPAWIDNRDVRTCDTVPMLASSLLQPSNVAVVVLGRHDSGYKLLQEDVFMVPYLKVNFAKLFPLIDLVIHHGGAGTTFTALRSGTPQIIVPNVDDCSDQLFHGGKVSQLGCGILLRPRKDINVDHEDVVEAARSLLKEVDIYVSRCIEASQKMQQEDVDVHGPCLAVQGLQRIVQAVVAMKLAGTWEGWTPEVSVKDWGRGTDEAMALKKYGTKGKE